MFITVFTNASHLSLSSARLIYATIFHSIHFNIIRLFSTWPLTFKLQTKYHSVLPTRTACLAHLTLLALITCLILAKNYESMRSSLCSFVQSSVSPKYLPQLPILKHPQPTFFNHCDKTRFTPIKTRCNIIVFCMLVFISLDLAAKFMLLFCTLFWQLQIFTYLTLLKMLLSAVIFIWSVPGCINTKNLFQDWIENLKLICFQLVLWFAGRIFTKYAIIFPPQSPLAQMKSGSDSGSFFCSQKDKHHRM